MPEPGLPPNAARSVSEDRFGLSVRHEISGLNPLPRARCRQSSALLPGSNAIIGIINSRPGHSPAHSAGVKATDIRKLREAGFINEAQEHAIVEHFRLDQESNRFLTIVGIIGAILVSAGIILLIASNWNDIPRMLKLGVGLALLLGCHGGGWALGRSGQHPVVAEVLHLIGSGLFLANIALVGQIYNLSSRPPNAILLWLAGVAPLAWILRSKAQHILALTIFGVWLGLELNQRDSWLYFAGEGRQFMVYALLGTLFAALGLLLGQSKFPEFGPPTEKFGLLATHIASYPLTLGVFYGSAEIAPAAWAITGTLTAVTLGLWVFAGPRLGAIPDRQWRWVWTAAQIGLVGLTWFGLTLRGRYESWETHRLVGPHWIAVPALFCFCLLQAQVGLIRRSKWLVNLAMVFIGLHIVTAYFQLFGSMQTTGMMFVVTGIFLIGLAVYLERKRRSLLRRFAASEPIPA